MDVRLPDGTIISNVPDNITRAELTTRLSNNGYDVSKLGAPETPKSTGQNILQGGKDLVGGLVRGAGSIGSTILAPWDMAMDAIDGKGFSLESNRQRRAGIDAGLTELIGSDPSSMLYQGGKLAGEVAGTAGAGGVLANGMRAVPALAKFAPVVQSGGLNLGPASTGSYLANLATRAAGGAINGAVTAGMIDPTTIDDGAIAGAALPVVLKGAQYAGKGVRAAGKHLLGSSTGTSAETISAAFNAGKNQSADFLANLRGEGSFDDVVTTAKAGLEKMRADRATAYRSGMMDISADKSVLDFAPIDTALQRVKDLGSYKGVQTNKHAAGVVDEIADTVSQWRTLNPAEYHTPEGLDALKRAIGDIRDSTQFGTPARKAADTVYNSVKNEITKQAPTYSKVMGEYAAATDELSQIERALSLGDKASKDTAIRKLQSLMRNNAQSNYGNRLSLAQQLEQKGGVELTPAIAGQAMNTWTPRGMTGAIQKAGGTAALGAAALDPTFLSLLALAPASSPRLVGEAAYKAGRLSSAAGNAGERLSGLLGPATPEALRLRQGLLTTLPIAISANQGLLQ